MDRKQKIGIVVGRFQPLQPGHRRLMQGAYDYCDFVKIVIGSAQYADPLPVEERRKRLELALAEMGWDRTRYEIVELHDINNLPRWPAHLKTVCRLTDETENYYYTNDQPSADFLRYLEMAGFVVCVNERVSFIYHGPDGKDYQFVCATEIRDLHRQLGVMDKL